MSASRVHSGPERGPSEEFRFFTGLRPSEQIALALSDLDLVNGIISINKARVSGVDRYKTKTGDDRRVQLCSRALLILNRQLRLRARLDAGGKTSTTTMFSSMKAASHSEIYSSPKCDGARRCDRWSCAIDGRIPRAILR